MAKESLPHTKLSLAFLGAAPIYYKRPKFFGKTDDNVLTGWGLRISCSAPMVSAPIVIDAPCKAFEGGTIEDAFHGTSEAVARSIITNGFRTGTESGKFGPGIYFFEGDHNAACWWAKDNQHVKNPVVIRAKVALGRTLLLNLLGKQMHGVLETLRSKVGARLASRGRTVELKDAYTVLYAAVRRNRFADSFKVVRVYNEEKRTYKRGKTLRAEIVVIVWDSDRIAPLEVLTPEELSKKIRVEGLA